MKNNMKKVLLFALCTVLLTLCASCSNDKVNNEKPISTPVVQTAPPQSKSLEELTQNTVDIVIELADGRAMNAELYPDLAPVTVENFLKLIDEDFFAGLIFHRVIPDFMIQGGGMDKDMTEKDAVSIKGEFDANGFENPLPHERGVLSMARLGNDNDSASSQFFIMHETSPHLDGQYAAFGKITDDASLAVVDEIATVQTTSVGMHSDVPSEPVIIKTIRRAQ